MVGLRLKEGVCLQTLVENAGLGEGGWVGGRMGEKAVHALEEAVLPFISLGAVFVEREEVGGWVGKRTRVVLTDPLGFLLSNEVIASMFAAVEEVWEEEEEEEVEVEVGGKKKEKKEAK